MDNLNWSKWLEPIKQMTQADVMVYHAEQGWLYGGESLSAPLLLKCIEENQPNGSEGLTFLQMPYQSELWIGLAKQGPEIIALLELLIAYLEEEIGPLTRQRAFKTLLMPLDNQAFQTICKQIYTDKGPKVWVWIRSDKGMAEPIVQLLQSLGHEDCAVVRPSLVALLLHIKKNENIEELIEGMHRLIEEDLYESVYWGVSQSFVHYDQLKEVMDAADRALKACPLTVNKQSWCFADRDILPILLASPDQSKAIMEAVDKKGLSALMIDDELIYTLECFYRADLNISDAANKLFIHRNTLIYRLHKIEKMTGLDPRVFSNAINLFAMVAVEKVSNGV